MAREAFVQFQQRPSGDYTPYLDSISRLAPDIEAARDRIERDRLMPSDLLDSLHEAGLLTLWLARPFGGQALRATDFIRIIEAISALDGSVGWCTCIAAGYSRLSGFLAPNVVRQIFAD